MEGTLWKWTNYWNGWQTRWFVLEDGVLAYYKSQEEVNQGCKGSVKVLDCEINVHTDLIQMDLAIPGEQHLYLKAASYKERQRWIVALGSAKACLHSKETNNKKNGDPSVDNLKQKKSELRLYCDLLMQQVHMVKTAANESVLDMEKMNDATSLLTATCDTFIKTLEECMKISNASLVHDLPNAHNLLPQSPIAGVPLKKPSKMVIVSNDR